MVVQTSIIVLTHMGRPMTSSSERVPNALKIQKFEFSSNRSTKGREGEMSDKLTRIAIVNEDKCKPKKCRQECKKSCPVVRMGKLCIEVDPKSPIAFISETLCIGCGICPKKCPFDAIQIINLPTNLESQVTHRFSANSFKLHRLPTPRPGQVLGLVGTNGIGKSTALKILAGRTKPNLGRYSVAFAPSSKRRKMCVNTYMNSRRRNGKRSLNTFVVLNCKTTLQGCLKMTFVPSQNHNMWIISQRPFLAPCKTC